MSGKSKLNQVYDTTFNTVVQRGSTFLVEKGVTFKYFTTSLSKNKVSVKGAATRKSSPHICTFTPASK